MDNNHSINKICVYCASSPNIAQSYYDATETIATILANNDIEVVFGGGAKGLMGRLADTIIQNNGKIKGIMPQFMNEVEWAHKSVSDFEFTQTMHQRKARFLEGIDGILALPGGCGTLEELLEAITLKRLGQFTKPIVILNTNNYYSPLKQMLELSIEEQFMQPYHQQIWTFVDQPEQVLPAMYSQPDWNQGAIKFNKSS
jgi:hypothetical protein